MTVRVLDEARGPASSADARVHRSDGGRPRRARPRRAVQPTALRRPAAGRSEPDGAHARAPERRLVAVVAEGAHDLPRQQRARPRFAPGVRGALRRRHRRAEGDHQRRRHHGDPHRRRLRARDAAARARELEDARDPRHRHAGALAPGGDARRSQLRARSRLERERQVARRRRERRQRRRGRARRRRRLHGDLVGRAGARARLAEARRPHQRGRVEHPERARARHGDDGGGRAVRRPPRVDRQRVRRLPRSRCARAPSTSRTSAPSSATC